MENLSQNSRQMFVRVSFFLLQVTFRTTAVVISLLLLRLLNRQDVALQQLYVSDLAYFGKKFHFGKYIREC